MTVTLSGLSENTQHLNLSLLGASHYTNANVQCRICQGDRNVLLKRENSHRKTDCLPTFSKQLENKIKDKPCSP